MKCAEDSLRGKADAIIANLKSNGISTLDLAWPGTGYNQPAYAGQFQVLMELERRSGDFRVENIIGASGGAGATALALVDQDRSAATMLEVWLDPDWVWYKVSIEKEYRKFKEYFQSKNWGDVKRYGYSSMKCRPNSMVIYALHDFKDAEQAAKAFAASGDIMNVESYSMGSSREHTLNNCRDGGRLMGIGSNPLLYYNTHYGKHMQCDAACKSELFKKGVAVTLRALLAKNLQSVSRKAAKLQEGENASLAEQRSPGGGMNAGDSVAIQKPRGTWTLNQFNDYLSKGGFWEILAGWSYAKRVFVSGATLRT